MIQGLIYLKFDILGQEVIHFYAYTDINMYISL